LKALIIRTSSLGDILQTLPLLKLFKGWEVDWVVEERCASILHHVPSIHRLITIDTKKKQWNIRSLRESEYDVVIDLQGNCKSALLTLLAKGKRKIGYTFRDSPEWPAALPLSERVPIDKELPVVYQYLTLVRAALEDPTPLSFDPIPLFNETKDPLPSKTLVVCPCSRWENKRLSNRQWITFLNRVAKEGFSFYIVYGSQEEKEEVEAIGRGVERATVVGGMTVSEWQELMSRSSGVITVDSSGMHLAFLAGVPVFSIFGASSGSRYAPPSDSSSYFQGECPYNLSFAKRCPKLRTCSSGACMKEIDPLDLYTAFKEWKEEKLLCTALESQYALPPHESLHLL